VVDPSKKGPVVDPSKKGPVVDPSKKGPVVDPSKKGPVVDPSKKKGPVVDPSKKGPVVDPTKKTGPIVGPGKKPGPVVDPTKKKGTIAGPGKKKPGPIGDVTKKPGPKGPKGQPGVNITIINKKGVPIFRGGRTIRIGPDIRRIVAISTLAVIAIGAASYYPYGYAAVPRPVCRGITAEGCTLRWQNVPTEEGDVVSQCVQYCPRDYVEPPLPVVTMPPPLPGGPAVPGPIVTPAPVGPAEQPGAPDTPEPVMASGSCEIVIYSEPKFGGVSSETGEDQPNLEEVGWAEEIASIEIKSGTWDLYSEGQYSGETIRLGVGSYPTLPPEWTKRINSFMCADPGE
jgi:hypothetical protein